MDKRVFLGFAEEKDTIWYFHPQINMIVQLNIPEMKVLYKRIVKKAEFEFVSLGFSDAYIWKQQIIFAPWDAQEILIYDRLNDVIETIPIKKGLCNNAHFMKILQKEDTIYLIPCCYESIVELDLNSRILKYHYKTMKDNFIDINGAFGEPSIIGEWALLPTLKDNKLVFLNLLNKEAEVYKIKGCNTWLRSVTRDEKYIYILPRFDRKLYIIRLDRRKECKEIFLKKEENRETEWLSNVFDCGSYLFLVQRFGNMSYIVEKDTWNVKPFYLFYDYKMEDKRITNSYKTEKYILIVLVGSDKTIGVYDITKQSITWESMPDWSKDILRCRFQKQNVLVESGKENTLGNFIEALQFLNCERISTGNMKTVGYEIYNKV